MEYPNEEQVKRKEVNVDAEFFFSNYIKTDRIQLEKFTGDSLKTPEVLNFYNNRNGHTSLPIRPKNARDVRDVFQEVSTGVNDLTSVSYAVFTFDDTDSLIGDITVDPIQWDNRIAEISFYIPEKTDLIPSLIASVTHVLVSDLGFRIVRIKSRPRNAKQVNRFVDEFGGVYEGIERHFNHSNSIGVRHTWTIAQDEIYGDSEPSDHLQFHEEE